MSVLHTFMIATLPHQVIPVFPAKPVSIPVLIVRFEEFVTDNQSHCVRYRVDSCPSARQLLALGTTVLTPIAEHILSSSEELSSDVREAFVRLLGKIASNEGLGHVPPFAYDRSGTIAWALWAQAKGN